MGCGFVFECSDCAKEFEISLDVGMLYTQYCKRVKDDALKGKYGKRAMKAVLNNPDGVFDCTRVIYKCECGFWHDNEKMIYCIPNHPETDCEYYDEWDETNSRVIWARRHPCPRCRKEMKRFDGDVMTLKCPVCGGNLKQVDDFLWD